MRLAICSWSDGYDYTIDFGKVLYSMGELTGPWNPALASAGPAKIGVSWSNNSVAGLASATDKAVVVAFNEAKEQFVFTTEGAARSSLLHTVIVPENFSGDEGQVWLAFISADGKLISTSVYLGSVQVD